MLRIKPGRIYITKYAFISELWGFEQFLLFYSRGFLRSVLKLYHEHVSLFSHKIYMFWLEKKLKHTT